jgi:hypothetical protein
MTVSEIRKAMNDVAAVNIRVDFIEGQGPVDLKVTKTEMRKVLKDFARADEVDAFVEGDTLIVNQAITLDVEEEPTEDIDVDDDFDAIEEEEEIVDEALAA